MAGVARPTVQQDVTRVHLQAIIEAELISLRGDDMQFTSTTLTHRLHDVTRLARQWRRAGPASNGHDSAAVTYHTMAETEGKAQP